MKNTKKVSNNELLKMKKELFEEFERVRLEMLKLNDYWDSIYEQYDNVVKEINKRGI